MALAPFLTALSAVLNALFLLAAVYVYISLARQIRVRAPQIPAPDVRNFGLPEAILALLLASWLVLNIAASSSQNIANLHSRDLMVNALFTIGLLVFVASFLRLRRLDLNSLGGFSRIGFWRTLATGVVLMLAAYPLIFLADLLMQRLLGAGVDRQGIVELFNASNTLGQRILIILLAITIAPIAEEFLFRFFIYGVLKRYFGLGIGLIANSLLFAAVHAHLPSFAPLFVLAACFTIAYEWSGSILVSMTMHALFNSLTLTALAFPELFQQ